MMYTRAYYDDPTPTVPESYGGNAFSDAGAENGNTYVAPTLSEAKVSPQGEGIYEEEECAPTFSKKSSGSFFEGLFDRLPFKKLFGGGRGILESFKFKLEIEDILIVSVAALLIFSKEGDTLFGLMLLALLFVS